MDTLDSDCCHRIPLSSSSSDIVWKNKKKKGNKDKKRGQEGMKGDMEYYYHHLTLGKETSFLEDDDNSHGREEGGQAARKHKTTTTKMVPKKKNKGSNERRQRRKQRRSSSTTIGDHPIAVSNNDDHNENNDAENDAENDPSPPLFPSFLIPEHIVVSSTALFIDAENISHRCISPLWTLFFHLPLPSSFKKGKKQSSSSPPSSTPHHSIITTTSPPIKRAYGDFSQNGLKNWKSTCLQFGLETIHHWNQRKKKTNDMWMVMDILRVFYEDSDSSIANYVIISGDMDFSPVIQFLRSRHKTVIGFSGYDESTSQFLPAVCSHFDIFFSPSSKQK